MASITSSDRRISVSKRRLKPLRDYLLDDLSSCSSNGFKSFPRRQSSSSTVKFLLDAEIKRSKFHHKRRLSRTRTTCGSALGHAVRKASTAFVNAVKLLPFPSSIKPPPTNVRTNKHGVFSRSFSRRLLSRSFWRKSDKRQDFGEIIGPEQIPELRSFAEFLQEGLDQPSDKITSSAADEGNDDGDSSDCISGESSSSMGSEYFGSSEVVQSSSTWSGESEVSNENYAVEDATESSVEEEEEEDITVRVGENVGVHAGDGSTVTRSNNLCNEEDNRKECVNEEKEQFSPVSVLENPFEDEDNASTTPSHQQAKRKEKVGTKGRRFGGLARLEPVDLAKRIEWHTVNNNTNQTEEEDEEERAKELFGLVKSRVEEANTLLLINATENLLLDFFQEDTNEAKDEERLVKRTEEWIWGRQEEMFMSWGEREKREVYVKEMERREKWVGCFNEERDCIAEELEDSFFTALVEELLLDLPSFS